MGKGTVAAAITGLLLTTTTGAWLSTSGMMGDLKEIEVHFYDKNETNSKVLKMKLDSATESNFKIREGTEENNYKWKYLYELTDDKDKTMYRTLFKLGNGYNKLQHNLNLIKQERWKKEKENWNICKDNKCQDCCKNQQCDCEKSVCICCWSDNADDKCCCKDASKECKFDQLKKKQNTFYRHLPNLQTSSYGNYISPVMSHIKLLDLSFDDLKQENSSSSTPEYKPFVGSFFYSFVDYYYKLADYNKSLNPDSESEKDQNHQMTEGKKYFFFNIPHRLTFAHKSNGKSPDTTSASKKNFIDTLSKEMDSHSKKLALQKKDSTTSSWKSCCSDTDDIECILGRNLIDIREEKDTSSKPKITKIEDWFKGIKDCCPNP